MDTPTTERKPPMHPALTFTIVGAFIVACVTAYKFYANRCDNTQDGTRIQSVYVGQVGGCAIYEVRDTVYDNFYLMSAGGTLVKNGSGREGKVNTVVEQRDHWQALKEGRPTK